VEAATRLRHCEVVVRQREVVHADVDVAGGRELLDGKLQERELGLGPGRSAASIRRCALNVSGRCA
jgi:hypothetical protein